MCQGLALHFHPHQRHPPAATGLPLTPSQAQIAAELTFQLNGEVGWKQSLKPVQAQPFKPGGELQLRLDPTPPTVDGDGGLVGELQLQSAICPVLIEANSTPTGCRQRQTGRRDPNPGGIDQANLKIQSGWSSTLGNGSQHPVRAFRVPAQIKLGPPDAHGEHRPQSLQRFQRIDPDDQTLNPRGGLILSAATHLDWTDMNALRTQAAVAADADRMTERFGDLRLDLRPQTLHDCTDHPVSRNPNRKPTD